MKSVFYSGICGAGQSGLAMISLMRGERVGGSDPSVNAAYHRLVAGGAVIYPGQSAANIHDFRPDLVVASAAIGHGDPELVAARELGIPVISRAERLGQLMAAAAGPRIGVAGTHGKTSTTALISQILVALGLDPTVLVGADIRQFGANVRLGEGGPFVAEACEAFSSFLCLAPDVAIVTTAGPDHLDHYGDAEAVVGSYVAYVSQVSQKGALVYCCDDEPACEVAARIRTARPDLRRIAYSTKGNPSASLWATDIVSAGLEVSYNLHRRRDSGGATFVARVDVPRPGEHHVANSLAALAAASTLGVDLATAAAQVGGFQGVERRFEPLGVVDGAQVIDDYAHHPDEIQATLGAARSAFPGRRLVVVFQPHLYSRTRSFLADFAQRLAAADVVVVCTIYAAREPFDPGISAQDIVQRIAEGDPEKSVLYAEDLRAALATVRFLLQPGDVVVTMGAGSITDVGHALAEGRDL